MPSNLTTYDAVLKDFFEGPIRDSLNEQVTFFNMVNARDERVGGRQLLFPVHTNRNWGVGTRAESGTLPTAQNETYVTATVSPAYWYGRIRLTKQVMSQSRGDRSAFAEALAEDMDRMVNNSRRYFNRALFVGQSAELARVVASQATADTATIVIDRPVGKPNRYMFSGMTLDGVNASSAASGITTSVTTDFTTATISSVAVAASGTVTLTFASSSITGGTATVTTVSGTILVMTGTYGQDPLGADEGIQNSGTYLGISRALANAGWRGNVLGNGGTNRPLSLNLLQSAWDAVSETSGMDDTITNLFAHYSVRREYINLLTPDVRFEAETFQGGQKVLNFNGVPFKFEVDAPYNTVYGMTASSWHLYKVEDFQWADEDNAILSRVNNQDSWDAFMRWFGNFATDHPNENFRLTDIEASL